MLLHAHIDPESPFCIDKHFLSSDTDDSEQIKDNELLIPDMGDSSNSACFRIFPNPFRDVFTLALCGVTSESVMTVEVYNIHGEIVIHEQVSTYHEHAFSLNAQPPGIYLVRVEKAESVEFQRMIKHN